MAATLTLLNHHTEEGFTSRCLTRPPPNKARVIYAEADGELSVGTVVGGHGDSVLVTPDPRYSSSVRVRLADIVSVKETPTPPGLDKRTLLVVFAALTGGQYMFARERVMRLLHAYYVAGGATEEEAWNHVTKDMDTRVGESA